MSAVLALFVSIAATAQVNGETSLSSWVEEFPESIDGVKIFSPQMENGVIRISDLVDFKDRDRDRVFINALSDIRSNADGMMEEVENVDVSGRRIKVRRQSPSPEGDATYNYSVAFQLADDMISFLIYDISISYKERGIVPRTQQIEKLKPKENRRHKELVDGFVVNASKYINRVAEAITADSAQKVTHWTEINNGTVVKGMNPTEVLMVRGKPSSVRTSGNRIKWMYGNERVVIFTDGLVSTVL